jgi:hypothetical protein
MRFDAPLTPAAGWHAADSHDYRWVSRIYGPGAHLLRQTMVADVGDPRFDKFGRPRTVVVDALTSARPLSLGVFPPRLVYHVDKIRLSDARAADLGYGVKADLFSAIDDKLLVTWDAAQWTWTNGTISQRVLVIAVDNHEDDAPFPQPTGALASTLNSLFTVLFRGNSAVYGADPIDKDDQFLTEFAHGLVRAQLEPLGVKP